MALSGKTLRQTTLLSNFVRPFSASVNLSVHKLTNLAASHFHLTACTPLIKDNDHLCIQLSCRAKWVGWKACHRAN